MTRSTRRRQQRSDPWPVVAIVLGAVLVALLALAALTLFGGSGDGEPSDSPAASPTDAAGASPSPSPAATPPSSTAPSPEPSPSTEPGASTTPGPSPSPGSSPSPDGDPAASCTGSDVNREFFREAAAQLPFGVYCGSLPGGWTLIEGSYRGSDGGRLLVAYQRSGGGTLFLREGNFCADDPSCPPDGTDLGPAKFGDLDGRLRATDGGYAVVVEVRSRLVYVLEAIGVGEEGTRTYAEDLVLVP